MINLLPPQKKQSVHYARMNISLIWYCILVLLVSAGLFGVLYFGSNVLSSTQQDLEASIKRDQQKVAELENIHKEAQELSSTVNVIGSILSREVAFSDLLVEIGSLMPPGAALSNLNLSENHEDPLTLDAIVTNEETAGILRENIIASDLFNTADIQSISATAPLTAGDTTYHFIVTFQAYFDNTAEAQP